MGVPTNYYVRSDGDDDADGLSHANAWATFQYALDTISPDADGDQINVKGTQTISVYGTGTSWDLGDYGTPTQHAPLIIRGYTSTANDGGIATFDEGPHVRVFGGTLLNWVHFADVFFHADGAVNQHFNGTTGIGWSFHRCHFSGRVGTAHIEIDAETSILFQDCLFEKHMYGIRAFDHADLHFSNCVFRRNNGTGTNANGRQSITSTGTKSKVYLHRCIFDSKTNSAGSLTGNAEIDTTGRSVTVRNCSFYNPNDNVKHIVVTRAEGTRLVFLNNLVEGYAVSGGQILYSTSSKDWYLTETGGNAAYDFTTWKDSNLHTLKNWGGEELSLTGSPFVDADDDDFTPDIAEFSSNFSVPSGWPKTGAAAEEADRGAIQRSSSGGSLAMPSERGLHPVDWGSV